MSHLLFVTQIPYISPSGDIASVSNRLGSWLARFDIATGWTDDAPKRTAGEEVQDIFATLADTGATPPPPCLPRV